MSPRGVLAQSVGGRGAAAGSFNVTAGLSASKAMGGTLGVGLGGSGGGGGDSAVVGQYLDG